MKFNEAIIVWNPGTDQIRVGPLINPMSTKDWTDKPLHYEMTGGAAYMDIRTSQDPIWLAMMLFITFHTIVVRDEVPVEAAHKAFLEIDEYRVRISRDIEGAE